MWVPLKKQKCKIGSLLRVADAGTFNGAYMFAIVESFNKSDLLIEKARAIVLSEHSIVSNWAIYSFDEMWIDDVD